MFAGLGAHEFLNGKRRAIHGRCPPVLSVCSILELTKLKNGHDEVTTLAYDDAGRETESKLSNGTKTSLIYDAANQTTGIVNLNSTNTTLSYYNYQFDGVGDRTSLCDNGVDVSNWNYDFTGQLTNDVYRPATTALNWNGLTVDQWFLLDEDGWDNLLADYVPTGGAGLLAYSPTGNWLTQTDPVTGDFATFTYNNGNRLLASVDVSGTTAYTYDDNGNQLTIEEPSGDVTTYAYNSDGLRVLQDDGVEETRFVYDGNNLVLELDDVGVVKADVTYLPAEYAQVLSQHRDLESSFYLCDGIHNVRPRLHYIWPKARDCSNENPEQPCQNFETRLCESAPLMDAPNLCRNCSENCFR